MNKAANKSKIPMYFGSTEMTECKAVNLRKRQTKAEGLLWQALRGNKVNGFKFRRQHPIYIFIADFYCHELKLVIELDGEIHNRSENKEYDKNRSFEIEQYGLKVIRFANAEIMNNLESVIERIKGVATAL